jgi:hypothetical protein
MNAFGEHPFENEAALDVLDLWNRLIADKLDQFRRTPVKIVHRLAKSGLSEPLYNGESYRSQQLIALGELFLKNHIEMPDDLHAALRAALGDELHQNCLDEWKSPSKRKETLIELCKRLKITPEPKVPFRVGVVEFASSKELRRKMEGWLDDNAQWENEYPRFCRLLDALIESRLGFDYDATYLDATQQRLMTLAFYLGKKLNMPRNAIVELVKRCQEFVWPGIAD